MGQETKNKKCERSIPTDLGSQVVISGISGTFPECDNMEVYGESLLRGADLITSDDRRWSIDHPEIPTPGGRIYGLEKFDANFFGVNYRQAHIMDPMSRMLMERAYEAIVDAGVNPKELRGKRLGVYVGTCYSESEKVFFYEKILLNGLGLTGCSRSLYANRISYWLNAKGPSISLDTACSSSMFAFQEAYEGIRSGRLDCALVGGCNLTLHPYTSLQFMRLGVLSPTGVCRPFDRDADGYVRSEAVAAVFLQKAEDARRVYATVVHAAVNCDGFKEQGITYPSGKAQAELMRHTCGEAGVDPGTLTYIEAHATATKIGDFEEVSAIDSVYCLEPKRKDPLLIGSVKGNLGHTEPASGVCSIAKVIIAMEKGIIPPNINLRHVKRSLHGIIEGRLKVVTEPTPWKGGLVAVNSFGFGGANAHVLLRSPPRDTASPADQDAEGEHPLPRLVLVSGRTNEAVDVLLDAVTRTSPPHRGLVQLLHAVHEVNTPGHMYRGFAVAGAPAPSSSGDAKAVSVRDAQHWSGERRPVWFVFAGMGSQWPAMGAALMRLPVFAAAVQRCHIALAPKGINIVDVITSKDPAVLQDILNCFVGIAAVQVGMVDVLRAVGIEPDVIIGHSVGELGCAYADGCLTAEQTILAAYSRGRASKEAKLIPGAMAAVGLSAKEVAPLCPEDVDVACHNGPDSSTISGPAASLRAFVQSLQARGVFAKEVACGGIAYHSRYIAPAGQLLLSYLKEVIPEPRARSERWLSSSVPEGRWGAAEAELCSAEYQTNNLLRSVLFEPLLRRVPYNAVAIEIAPHGLLQAILKRALSPEALNVPLARRGTNSLLHLLAAIGRLYCAGLQPRPGALYPAPQWPVPPGTPMISPLVHWAHDDDWFVTNFQLREKVESAERIVKLSANDNNSDHMLGHIIDGKTLVPSTAYLKMVWETLAALEKTEDSRLSVVFEDIRFLRATLLPTKEGETLDLVVNLHRGSGEWEVSDKGTVVASGRVRSVEDAQQEMMAPPPQSRGPRPAPADVLTAAAVRKDDFEDDAEEHVPAPHPTVGDDEPDFDMSEKHVYKTLRLRGYNYKGLYRGIHSASLDGKRAIIRWKSSWVPFLDALLQMQILSDDSSQLYVPISIEKMVIDSVRQAELLKSMPSNRQVFEAQKVPELDIITTGTVEVRGLYVTQVPRSPSLAELVLEHYTFVPYDGAREDDPEWQPEEAARVCVQLLQENRAPITRTSPPVRVAELLGAGRQPLTPLLLGALADLPLVQAKATVFLQEGAKISEENAQGAATTAEAAKLGSEKDVAMLVLSTGPEDKEPEALATLSASLSPTGCLVIRDWAGHREGRGATTALRAAAAVAGLQLALRLKIQGGEQLLVFRKGGWRADPAQLHLVRVPEMSEDSSDGAEAFAWVERLQTALRDPNPVEKRVVLVARGRLNGALGLFNCLRQEPGAGPQLARLYLLPEEADGESEGEWDEAILLRLLRPRLELDLSVNVLQGGRWGCMRHLSLKGALSVPVRHAFCDTVVRGGLSSQEWFQDHIEPGRLRLPPYRVLVHVHYAGLNFHELLIASRKLDGEPVAEKMNVAVGYEFSGRLADGRRVMGMKMGGSVATEVFAHTSLLWEIPRDWSLQQGATVPVAYLTAVYALDMVGRMAPGDSVLVHAASGAVGQAALTLALARGCRVFATVGTAQKRDFLLRAFPQLSLEDIGNSRDTSFEFLVKQRTGGRGVDIVLNSLADDKLQASLRCVATGGRFLEIGKVDMFNNTNVGMRMFLRRVHLHGIVLDRMIEEGEHTSQLLELTKRFGALIKEDIIRPIEAELFSPKQIQQAFRYVAAGKHMGKVVIAIREGEPEFGVTQSLPVILSARPRFYCQPDASYVIIGGLGGLGLELAHWLVRRGVRHLVLVSRSGVTTGYQARRLKQWRDKGVRALVRTDDASTRRGAESLLLAAAAVAPVAAIFNLAVVLRDALFDNQTAENFAESFRCKATATVQLDAASRRLCPRLRHFVLFSSVSCGRGNGGQTNYGLANSVMERVAWERRAAGLPATAVQWGAVGDVGLVADLQDDDRVLEIGGTLQQRLDSCLEVLDGFLAQPHAVVSSMVVAEKRARNVEQDLVSTVALLLGLRDLERLNAESSLDELGMDFMTAVEIQQILEREFNVLLSPRDVRGLTFGRLREIQHEKEERERKARASPARRSFAATTSNSTTATEAVKGKAAVIEVLRMMFGAITDELTARKTVVSFTSEAKKSIEFKDVVAVMFPGLEGVATALEPLTRGLDVKSVALQLPFEIQDYSVTSTVDELMPHVREHSRGIGGVSSSSSYVLVGYSYGGLLALEAAARLEAESSDCQGHLVLLDSSPLITSTMVKLLLSSGAENALFGRVNDDTATNFREGVQQQESSNARLQLLSERTNEAKCSTEYKSAAVNVIYQRLMSALRYEWPKDRPRLQASVTLIRPSRSVFPPGLVPDDGGLSQICERPVRVCFVDDADHSTLPRKRQTSIVLNAVLEETRHNFASRYKDLIISPNSNYYHGIKSSAI